MRAKDFLPEKKRDPKGVAQGVADFGTDFADKLVKTFGGDNKLSNIQKPTGGDRLRNLVGLGKDKPSSSSSKDDAKAPEKNTKAPAPTPEPAQKLPRQEDIKPGSAYSDGKVTWTFDGTKWSDGKNMLNSKTGYRNFVVALQKGKAIQA